MAAVSALFESALEELARERRELDAAEAAWVVKVGEYDRSQAWAADGFLSAAAAVRDRCNMTHAIASAAVRLAKRLEQLPATKTAFGAGEISREHARLIAAAYTPERSEALGDAEQTFAQAATQVHVGDLADLIKYTVGAIDGDGGAGDDEDEYAKNRFHASPVGDRVATNGSHCRETGEMIMAALDAIEAKLHPQGDGRHRSARQAEALVEICRQSLAHDHTKARKARRGRPHMSVVADLQTLQGQHPDLIAAVRAEAEHAGRLSHTTLERIACDCEVSRIITDGPSTIIDVGRKTRTVPLPLWNALVVRDQHCREAGCKVPAGFCEAHHIWYWSRGGPTNLNNLLLLCWHHHRQRHLREARARPG